MAAQAGTRIERHVSEGLGGGRIDNFPDIDIHAQAEHFQLVHQCDIYAAENILEQLGHFRGARGADRNDFSDHLAVKGERGARAGGIYTTNDFRDLRQAILLVAGIFALGRKGEEKIARDVFVLWTNRDFAVEAAFLEDGENELFGGARVGSRFQDDQLTLLQIGLNREGGLLHVAQIGFTAFIEGSRHADDDGVAFLELLEIGGGAEVFAIHKLLNLGLLNVLDVRFAGVEHGDFFRIGIETGNLVARFGKT